MTTRTEAQRMLAEAVADGNQDRIVALFIVTAEDLLAAGVPLDKVFAAMLRAFTILYEAKYGHAELLRCFRDAGFILQAKNPGDAVN